MASLPDERLDDADTSSGPRRKHPSTAGGDAGARGDERPGSGVADHRGRRDSSGGAADAEGTRTGGASSGTPQRDGAPEAASTDGEGPAVRGGASDVLADVEPQEEPRQGLTPREARRVRALTAAVCMVCIAVGLLVQLSGETSLMTIALYGIAMVLSGVAIKLSYAGRTRVAMAVVVLGFGLVVAEQVLHWL